MSLNLHFFIYSEFICNYFFKYFFLIHFAVFPGSLSTVACSCKVTQISREFFKKYFFIKNSLFFCIYFLVHLVAFSTVKLHISRNTSPKNILII